MMWRALTAMVLLLAAQPVRAELMHSPEAMPLGGPMVADISQSRIQIHSSFNGAQLLVFGARNTRGDLVIAVRGPRANVTMRRKERIAGMWMHVERHKYPQLPLFYAIASSRPLKDITAKSTLYQLGLGEQPVITASNRTRHIAFDRALKNTLARKRVWQEPFDTINYFGESLFKARLDLPDTLPRGHYTVEVYLFNEGKLVAFQTIPLLAYKTGMDASISDKARNQPWLYGIGAIIMALAGGWLGHRLFHRT